jgi:hypothetical protein
MTWLLTYRFLNFSNVWRQQSLFPRSKITLIVFLKKLKYWLYLLATPSL